MGASEAGMEWRASEACVVCMGRVRNVEEGAQWWVRWHGCKAWETSGVLVLASCRKACVFVKSVLFV